MSRVLIVVPPLTGHINPTVGVGSELSARGHDVAWSGLPGVVDRLLPRNARFLPLTGDLDQAAFDEMQRAGAGLRGPEALKFLWEGFIIPYARHTIAELSALAEGFRPDLILVDQQALAGAVVARLRGIPWVTSATTSAELTDPLAGLPKLDEWVRNQMRDLQIAAGVAAEVAGSGDLRFSDDLIIAFTTSALLGPVGLGDRQVRCVGPAIAQRTDLTGFDWEWLDSSLPHVLVSLGTVNAEMGSRFFAAAIEALSSMPVQAVIVAPASSAVVPDGVSNLLVRDRVPQLALLAQMDVVVTHGGHNTVCESLAHGLPLVVAPIRDDQPIVADQVVRSGAGVRVRFGRTSAAELGEAIRLVLKEPAYRQAATLIQQSFRQAGGTHSATDAIEDLLSLKGVKC